jgi:hypothetical protein
LSAAINSLALFFNVSILKSNFFSFSSKVLIFTSKSLSAASILIFFSAICYAYVLGGGGGGVLSFLSYPPKSFVKNDILVL